MIKTEETGAEVSDQIYADPDDPKKKKYDELKRKAMIVAAKRPRKHKVDKNGELISETDSVVSDVVSESGFSVSSKASVPMSVKSVSSASTTMPFLTFTKQPKPNKVESVSERGASPTAAEKLVDFVNPKQETERKRSYSPV